MNIYGCYKEPEWRISPSMAKFLNDFVMECEAKSTARKMDNHILKAENESKEESL